MYPEIKISPNTLKKLLKGVKGRLKAISESVGFDQSYVYVVLAGQRRITEKNICIVQAAQREVLKIKAEKKECKNIAKAIETSLA